jgi:hypothetical protein
MDNSLRTVEEIERELGLPVLGTIPRLIPANLSRRRSPRRRRADLAGAVLLFILPGPFVASSNFDPAAIGGSPPCPHLAAALDSGGRDTSEEADRG